MKKFLTSIAGTAMLIGASPFVLAAAPNTASETERTFLNTFLRVGAEHSYDDETLSTTHFDFAAYRSDPCYSIVGPIEQEQCEARFGPFANLQALFENGELMSLIQWHTFPNSADDTTDVLGIFQSGTVDETTQPDETPQADHTLYERSQTLWRVCEERYGADSKMRCFQRNQRLLDRSDIPIEDNVSFTE